MRSVAAAAQGPSKMAWLLLGPSAFLKGWSAGLQGRKPTHPHGAENVAFDLCFDRPCP